MDQIDQLLNYPIQFTVSFLILILLGFVVKAILGSISEGIDIEHPTGIDEGVWKKLVRIPGQGSGF